NEKTRLEFRYIDLRHPKMQSILRLRSHVMNTMRQFLTQQYGFVEVETPTLFKATPGGAKEFVVPTEFKDCYYNLVQSPQQFKQLLMVGGIDRYFQIARCYRNEGTKPDRQPEFTQLDLEMSFTSSDGIMSLIEELIHSIGFVENYEPFPRMAYADAMQHYGTDKPDLRSDIKIRAVDTYEMNAPIDKDVCLTLVINDLDKDINDEILRYMDSIGDIKRELQFSGQLTHELAEDSNQLNFDGVSEAAKQCVVGQCQPSTGAHIWVVEGSKRDAYRIMGRIRADCVKLMQKYSTSGADRKLSFVWITDFPLFTPKEESAGYESTHHPFTAPRPQDSQLLRTDPGAVLGQHFDLVLNGQEVGGGSIRIHDHQMQAYVLREVLKEDIQSMRYFLDALRSGCPPHGGIALGLDRLLATVLGTDSIRDVIAFPKSAHGRDLMAGSPTAIPPVSHYQRLIESGILEVFVGIEYESNESLKAYHTLNHYHSNLLFLSRNLLIEWHSSKYTSIAVLVVLLVVIWLGDNTGVHCGCKRDADCSGDSVLLYANDSHWGAIRTPIAGQVKSTAAKPGVKLLCM
ncbi:unnamed protein product, partial [Oppiella nova]